MNIYFQALAAVLVLATKLVMLKAAGLKGQVRTKIIAEDTTGGPPVEIPFYTFTI